MAKNPSIDTGDINIYRLTAVVSDALMHGRKYGQRRAKHTASGAVLCRDVALRLVICIYSPARAAVYAIIKISVRQKIFPRGFTEFP